MNHSSASELSASNLTRITYNMSVSDARSRSSTLPHSYHPLTPWQKLFMMSGGGTIVCVTLVIVVCLVFPICWCHRQCCPDDQVEREMEVGPRKKPKNKKKNASRNGQHALSSSRAKDLKRDAHLDSKTIVANRNTRTPSNYAIVDQPPRRNPRTPGTMKRVSMSPVSQQHDFDPTSWLSHSHLQTPPQPNQTPESTTSAQGGETAALGFSTAYGTRSYGSLQQLIHAEAALAASQRSRNHACGDPEARQSGPKPVPSKRASTENGLEPVPNRGTEEWLDQGGEKREQRPDEEHEEREEQQASSSTTLVLGDRAKSRNGDPTNSPLVPLTQDEYGVARNSNEPTTPPTNNTLRVETETPQEEEKLQRGISSSRSGSLETDEGTTTTTTTNTTTDSIDGEGRPDNNNHLNRNWAHQSSILADQRKAHLQSQSGPTSRRDSSHGSIMSLGSSSILTRPNSSTPSGHGHMRTRRASSPTSLMSLGSTLSALSFGKSPTASSNSPQSPTRMIRSFSREKNVLSSVTFSVHLEHDHQDETNGILTIGIESAKDLPLRDYGAPCDVMIHVSLHRDRRSLRKRSRHVFADFKTDVVKQDQNPTFGQSFKTNVPWSDYKNLRMKLSAFDYDRHSKVTEIGTTSLYLKEIKHLNTSPEGLIMTNFLAQKKQEYGELMFGMSYLPTAQRLSFSIMKATNLKYEEIVPNLDNFVPYVRILQLSASGKVVKKKKTSARPGTKEPAFNETLNFDLNPNQLESTAFMVLLSHKQTSFELQDMDSASFPETQMPLSERVDSSTMSPSPIPSPRQQESSYSQGSNNDHFPAPHYRHRHRHQGKDLCLGRIVLGSFVRGERERGHWASVISSPRKVFTMWQTLY